MNTELVSAPKEKIIAIHKKAHADGKAALIEAFGPHLFFTDIASWEAYIIPRVNSFEDACREAGVQPSLVEFSTGTPDEIAYRKGKFVCDILNAPFIHLMKDTVSRKWSAWMEKTDTGFRFDGAGYDHSGTHATGGSRLRLCSEKLAKHFGITFAEMMVAYWWNE